MGAGLPKGDGILLNTWEDMEPATLNALRDHKAMAPFAKVPTYPIGPLTRSVRDTVAVGGTSCWIG